MHWHIKRARARDCIIINTHTDTHTYTGTYVYKITSNQFASPRGVYLILFRKRLAPAPTSAATAAATALDYLQQLIKTDNLIGATSSWLPASPLPDETRRRDAKGLSGRRSRAGECREAVLLLAPLSALQEIVIRQQVAAERGGKEGRGVNINKQCPQLIAQLKTPSSASDSNSNSYGYDYRYS